MNKFERVMLFYLKRKTEYLWCIADKIQISNVELHLVGEIK